LTEAPNALNIHAFTVWSCSMPEHSLVDEPGDMDAATLDSAVEANIRDVLVVDDSRVALRFLQTRLEALGYRVHLARNALQAREMLTEHPYWFVFLDVMLEPAGGAEGFALCQHIKRRSTQPGGIVPIVVMVTGLTSSTDRVRGTLAGCDAYLTKPLLEDEFTRTLRLLDPDLANT
jgi:DNA-binding response OmpR family regulator